MDKPVRSVSAGSTTEMAETQVYQSRDLYHLPDCRSLCSDSLGTANRKSTMLYLNKDRSLANL
jgi:hypothetical protein